MVPLRILAIITNCFLIVYFTGATHAWLPLLLQIFALPINAYRLYQMLDADRKRARSHPRPSLAGLAQAFHGGAAFQEGRSPVCQGRDRRRNVLHRERTLCAGRAWRRDPNRASGRGAGFLSPDNRRTATLECIEEGKVLSITYEQVEQLYYQNPTFGFYFLRLCTARLFDNIGRLEGELERRRVEA